MDFNISKAANLIAGKVEQWIETLIAMLPNLVVAVIVLVLFYLAGRIVRRIAQNIFKRVSDRKAINDLFSTIIYLLVISLGAVIALNILDLQGTVASILAGAGIIGLALGFAFQDIAANFMAGILLAVRQPIKVGDIIETNSYMGKVEAINLRATMLETFQGLHVIIPNKDVFQNPLTNYTKTYTRRIDLSVGVSYGEDLERVKKITIDAIKALPFVLQKEPIDLFYHEFGDSSINFDVVFWINYTNQGLFLTARSEAIIAVKKAYDENGITIPFPIRTLDFGIKGGEKLSEQMKSDK